MIRKLFGKSILGFGILAVAGCGAPPTDAVSDAQAPEGGQIVLANMICPIMGGNADEKVITDWNEKTIGFCCAECIPKWNKLTDEQKGQKLAEARTKEGSDDAGEKGHDHDDNDHDKSQS